MESQIILLWPYLNHLQKNIGQLVTLSFLMIQLVCFTSAAFEAFAEAYLGLFAKLFLFIQLAKVNKMIHLQKKPGVSEYGL